MRGIVASCLQYLRLPIKGPTTVWTQIKARLFSFASHDTGATAIEYALIASAIFLGIAPIWSEIAPRMGAMYNALLDYFAAVGAI